MIEARSLRIGNIHKSISFMGAHTQKYLSNINQYYRELEAEDIVSIDKRKFDFHPIPITTEWLKMFGWNIHSTYYIHNGIACEYSDPHSNWYLRKSETSEKTEWNLFVHTTFASSGFNKMLIGKPFQYMHELQNVWWRITGEELTIKVDAEEQV